MVSRIFLPVFLVIGLLSFTLPALASPGLAPGVEADTTPSPLLWFKDGDLTTQGEQVIALVQESWTHGLNPDKYNAQSLQNIGAYSPSTADAMISKALKRYVSDLNGIKTPSAITAGLDPRDWAAAPDTDKFLPRLAHSPDVRAEFEALLPKDPLYERLRRELTNMLTTPPRRFEPVSLGKTRYLKAGDRHAAVPELRTRLMVRAPDFSSADIFDPFLTHAVKNFQYLHGITVDGIVGPQTIAALNKTPEDYYRQIITTMERLRRIPREKPGRLLEVNIANGRLRAFENRAAVLNMRVVTGRLMRETRSFAVDVVGVRLNPDWTVPPTIKKEDYLPMLQEDPAYFIQKDIALYDGYGPDARRINPMRVNWDMIEPDQMAQVRMVQPPGDANALGRIRLLMPNRFGIFLHDTNHPALFAEPSRFFSSGCVRMAEPEAAAHWVMAGTPGWSDATMREMLESRETTDISAARPPRAHILYQTIWEDGDGRLIFGPDPYGWDRELFAALTESHTVTLQAEDFFFLAATGRP